MNLTFLEINDKTRLENNPKIAKDLVSMSGTTLLLTSEIAAIIENSIVIVI